MRTKVTKLENREFILRCSCGELWDSTVFTVFHEQRKCDGDGEWVEHDFFVSQNIQDSCFWRRLVNCIRYLFKQFKFWNYGETSLMLNRREDFEKLESLIRFLRDTAGIASPDVFKEKK